MSDNRPAGSDSRRSFVFLKEPFFYLFLLAALLLLAVIDREMWFDEVLTLTNFAALPDAAEIYRRYTIPNNHIVYSVILHGWWNFFPALSDAGLRMLSVFAALGTVAALWFGFRKESGELPLALALASWIVSPAFALYATAVRGYIFCTLFVVLALLGAKAYFAGQQYGAAVWFLFSLLAVGTMPSAIAALGGAGIMLLPPAARWKTMWKKIVLLALLPFAAFALFYLPILPQLLHCAALGEGSTNAVSACGALVVGIFSAFGVLILAVDRKNLSWKSLTRLVWLLPAAAIFVLPKAPFPRIFFPFFPLFALLLARAVKGRSCKTHFALLAAVIVWGGAQKLPPVRDCLSSLCALAGQDDFISPRFMRKEFVPSQSAVLIAGKPRVFVSFDADPWALLWALSRRNALPPEYLFDGPGGKVPTLAPNTLIVMTHGEKKALEARFGTTIKMLDQTPLHNIGMVER